MQRTGRPRRFAAKVLLFLLLLGTATLQRANAEDAPPPMPSATEKETPPAQPETPKSPGERAQDRLKDLNKNCLDQATGQFEYNCAIRIYYDAGNILREANIEPDDQPRLWWTIYEGLGLAFAQIRRFEKAKEFFQIAGQIQKAGPRAREESAYNLGAVEYELGDIKEAVHTFDVLFGRDTGWVSVAHRDPALEKLRATPEWKKMIAPHKEHMKEEGLPVP